MAPASIPIDTPVVSKQLLPVYDKPMVYYLLTTLMLAGIRDILVHHRPRRNGCASRQLLGDGAQWGIKPHLYRRRRRPEGLAQAFILGREFIGADPVALVLGDNIFYGGGLSTMLVQAAEPRPGATIFAYQVRNAASYGVVEFAADGTALRIEEKPARPRSNWAVTGLYFYDNAVVETAAALKPPARGELEITDLNNTYLRAGALRVERLGRGSAWFDTGTHDLLIEAGESSCARSSCASGLKIACPEEVAFALGYIGLDLQVAAASRRFSNSEYALPGRSPE